MTRIAPARMPARLLLLFILTAAMLASPAHARIDTERYGKLREVERYQMDVAEELARQGKWESALAEYEKFIALYQSSVGAPYAQYWIAVCQEQRNFINKAIVEYKALIAYFPDSPEAPLSAFAIGRCLGKTGELELAVQQYLAVVEKYPKSPSAGDALWEASEIQLGRDLYDKALQARRTLIANYPKCSRFASAADWLVDHYLLKADDIAAARTTWLLAMTPLETEKQLGLRLFNHGYRASKSDPKQCLVMMDKSISVYQGIQKQFPDDKESTRDAAGMIAQCYRYSNRPDEAIQAFELVLRANPDADNLRSTYASFLESVQKWSEARAQFLLFADKAKGAYEVAGSYHREQKVADAEAAYTRVVSDYPELAQVSLYQIGQLHQSISKDYEKAINAYRQSEYSAPTHLFRIADCFSSLKKHDMAIKTLQEIIGFFPDHAAEATWQIGLCYENRGEAGDAEKAISTFKRICDVHAKSKQSSWAHQRLETKYSIPYTGGGVK